MGTTINPGWGTAIGGVVGGVAGFLSAPKKVNTPQVPLVDFEQLKLQRELERKREAVNAGVSTEFSTASSLINAAQAGAMESVTGLTGGDVGSALAGMESISKAGGSNVNALLSTITAQDANYANLIASQVNEISKRKLSLQMMASDKALAQNAQAGTDTKQQLMSTIGSPAVMSMLTSFKGIPKASNTENIPTSWGTYPTMSAPLSSMTPITPINIPQPKLPLLK
jgi:gas vesicle protein